MVASLSATEWLHFVTRSALLMTRFARVLVPRYSFNFTPSQLAFFCQCIDAQVPGSLVEAGCAAGVTTVFLNKHMSFSKIEKPYYALDTFSGFTPDDRAYEVATRGKAARALRGFSLNSKRWFDRAMAINEITRVTSIQTDLSKFDFDRVAPISFCLLDVDLYLPTRAALPRIYERLSPGGIVVVDDCLQNNVFDGAQQAYSEFVRDAGLNAEYVHGKLGVIRKPGAASA